MPLEKKINCPLMAALFLEDWEELCSKAGKAKVLEISL